MLIFSLFYLKCPSLQSGGSLVRNPPASAGDVNSILAWVRKIPWSRKWQPTPVFLSGQRSLVGYSLWGFRVRHDSATKTTTKSLWQWETHHPLSLFHQALTIIHCYCLFPARMPSSLHSGSDSLTQSAFQVWMPTSTHSRSDTPASLPFHKDRSSPCWLSDSHTWNVLFTLGSSKPPSAGCLLHPAQALPYWAWHASSPTPSLWMASLVHKGLWRSMLACPPKGCPLIPHARPLLQQDSSASSGSDTTCQDASLHRDAPSHLCSSDPYMPSSRGHPPCLSWAQTRAAVHFRCPPHSAQTPVPSSGPLWLVHPCTRYQVWRSTFLCPPNGFRATSFKNKREEKRKIP